MVRSMLYERKLAADIDWALHEGGAHFESRSSVHRTLTRIAERLDALGIPYAVVGAMAMFVHGYRRFTEDVDLLVTAEGLRAIHDQLAGRGYLAPYPGGRNLRDTESGVRVEFVVTGEFPGDGRPKSVSFPAPEDASTDIGGIRYVDLPELIEMKLASGISSPGRLRDLADVQEMIRVLALPAAFTDQLDPSVRDKFGELRQAVSPEMGG